MRKFAASCCRTALLLTLLCSVSGCQQTSYRLDTRHRATNQDSRARFLASASAGCGADHGAEGAERKAERLEGRAGGGLRAGRPG